MKMMGTFLVVAAIAVWFVWQTGRVFDAIAKRHISQIEDVLK